MGNPQSDRLLAQKTPDLFRGHSATSAPDPGDSPTIRVTAQPAITYPPWPAPPNSPSHRRGIGGAGQARKAPSGFHPRNTHGASARASPAVLLRGNALYEQLAPKLGKLQLILFKGIFGSARAENALERHRANRIPCRRIRPSGTCWKPSSVRFIPTMFFGFQR